jgi:hypothetical protein
MGSNPIRSISICSGITVLNWAHLGSLSYKNFSCCPIIFIFSPNSPLPDDERKETLFLAYNSGRYSVALKYSFIGWFRHLLPTVIHDIQVSSNAFLLLLQLQQQSSYGKIALKLKIMKCMFERMREPLGQLETHVWSHPCQLVPPLESAGKFGFPFEAIANIRFMSDFCTCNTDLAL